MFGFFKRRRPNLLDATIQAMYGPKPPPKSADVACSIAVAHEDLLKRKVPLSSVRQHATDLHKGPMPYSTHDLAVSTALAFSKDPEWVDALDSCQVPARTLVLNWLQNGKINGLLAEAFEKTLYERYHQQRRAAQRPGELPDFAGLISQLMMLQVASKYENPRQLLPDLESRPLALGYVFGFHDACLRMTGKKEVGEVPTEIAQVYMTIFGQREGFVLFQKAIKMQEDREFYIGRLSGGEDYAKFIMEKVPPLGLQRILILGFDEQAVKRGLNLKPK